MDIDWNNVIENGTIICPKCGSNDIDGQPDSTFDGQPTGRYAVWCLGCGKWYAACSVNELNALIQQDTTP